MNAMSTFIYVVRLVNSEMFEKMSSEEEAVVEDHFNRLKKAQAKGKLILAGPTLDGKFGIVVFRAPSREAAEEFMKNDPAVKEGIMTAELHPFRVSLIEKTE
jgi:uncharacterized protein YciI